MTPPATPSGILHIYAHPDDESFGNPATIALYAVQGHPMSLVTLTRGEAGETNGVCRPEELGDVREAELRHATTRLGIGQVEVWDYGDGRLADADADEIISRLVTLYSDIRPEVIVTYGDEGTTGHPDHIAASRFATAAFFRHQQDHPGQSPFRLYWRVTPEKRRFVLNRPDIVYRTDYTTIVDARQCRDARPLAEACHRTQRTHTDYGQPSLADLGAVDYYVRIFPKWNEAKGIFEADLFGEGRYSDETNLP